MTVRVTMTPRRLYHGLGLTTTEAGAGAGGGLGGVAPRDRRMVLPALSTAGALLSLIVLLSGSQFSRAELNLPIRTYVSL